MEKPVLKNNRRIWLLLCSIFSISVYTYALRVIIRSFSDEMLLYHLTVLVSYLCAAGALAVLRILFKSLNVRNNSAEINRGNFGDVHDLLSELSEKTGTKRPPRLYISAAAPSGSFFHSGFRHKNSIFIYKEFFSGTAPDRGRTLAFILTRELIWRKDNTALRNLFLLPSAVLPPLYLAYLRETEIDLDRRAALMFPDDAVPALLRLGFSADTGPDIGTLLKQYKNRNIILKIAGDLFSAVPSYLKRLENAAAAIHEY